MDQVKSIDFIRILKNQLNSKDEQIKEKNNQLNALLILLNKEKDIKLISDSVVMDKADASPEPKGFF